MSTTDASAYTMCTYLPWHIAPVLLLLVTALLVSGCVDELFGDNCIDGRVERIEENVALFPDSLVLQLREEPYSYSITDPPLFRHTGGAVLTPTASHSDPSVAEAYIHFGGQTALEADVAIFTRSVGTALVYVGARYDCDHTGQVFPVFFEVVDTTVATRSSKDG